MDFLVLKDVGPSHAGLVYCTSLEIPWCEKSRKAFFHIKPQPLIVYASVRQSNRHTPCAVCIAQQRHTECAFYLTTMPESCKPDMINSWAACYPFTRPRKNRTRSSWKNSLPRRMPTRC